MNAYYVSSDLQNTRHLKVGKISGSIRTTPWQWREYLWSSRGPLFRIVVLRNQILNHSDTRFNISRLHGSNRLNHHFFKTRSVEPSFQTGSKCAPLVCLSGGRPTPRFKFPPKLLLHHFSSHTHSQFTSAQTVYVQSISSNGL